MKRNAHSAKTMKRTKRLEGNTETMVSTGSTLLDLAITGGRVYGGGIPGGILVEIFGPSGMGKTVLLCEIAGAVKRAGGAIMFQDPEARLDKAFANLFDLQVDDVEYETPDTVPQLFKPVRTWNPAGDAEINGVFADSLAALSTKLEMDKDDGDKMGMRRAKEFSEETRKTCRILKKKNHLMVCSNQVRDNPNAGPYDVKYKTPGGRAIEFYASLRLRMMSSAKIKLKRKVPGGKEVYRVAGITTNVEVHKSSVWQPFRTAPISIIFDYGIDDIRENLKFIKTYTTNKTYMVGSLNLGNSLEPAILKVEAKGLEGRLRKQVIVLWTTIERQFKVKRKKKIR